MRLRNLELKDAPLMLEWMQDKSVVAYMQTDFTKKTIKDCERFITSSLNDKSNLHLAIADNEDTYMGTVSLKHIQNNSAEFAIAVRSIAMGKGYSKYAMAEIIRIGHEDIKLDLIYWCVLPENKRAVRFYNKNGYQKISEKILFIPEGYTAEQIRQYLWYIA